VLDVDVGEDPVRPVAILLGIALSAERGRIVGDAPSTVTAVDSSGTRHEPGDALLPVPR
jgi:hypothetical protein